MWRPLRAVSGGPILPLNKWTLLIFSKCQDNMRSSSECFSTPISSFGILNNSKRPPKDAILNLEYFTNTRYFM